MPHTCIINRVGTVRHARQPKITSVLGRIACLVGRGGAGRSGEGGGEVADLMEVRCTRWKRRTNLGMMKWDNAENIWVSRGD